MTLNFADNLYFLFSKLFLALQDSNFLYKFTKLRLVDISKNKKLPIENMWERIPPLVLTKRDIKIQK